MATADKRRERSANPFDSDQEDDALDPSNRVDDEDEMIDFSMKKVKIRKPKLKGQAKTVKTLDDEAGAEVIGQMWSNNEPAKGKKPGSEVTKRWNFIVPQDIGPGTSARKDSSASASARSSEKEIERLRQALQFAEAERWLPLRVEEAARRLVLGQPVWLEGYQSLRTKLALLEEVEKLHDGNALLKVILFMRRTLRETTFLSSLVSVPNAQRHYVHYLRQLEDWTSLEKFYIMFAQRQKTGFLMYQQCAAMTDSLDKLNGLRKCERYFRNDRFDQEAKIIKEEINLLEIQRSLDVQDEDFERRQHHTFVQFPRKEISLHPLMTTLFYCCLYHFKAPESKNFSPTALKRDFELTERQFLWMALGALAKRRDYPAIEDMLTVKGWFGNKKQKSAIGFDKVVEILRQHRATPDKLGEYIRKVDDLQLRLEVARKVDVPEAVIETLKLLKDREGLAQYRDRFPPHHRHREDIDRLLRNSTIRWKN